MNDIIHSLYVYGGLFISTFGGTLLGQIFATINTRNQNKFSKRIVLWDALYKESNKIRLHIEEVRYNLKHENQKKLKDIFSEDDTKTKIIVMDRDERFIMGLGIGFDIIAMYMPKNEFENYFILSELSATFKEPRYFFRSLGRRYKNFNKNLKAYAANQNKNLLIAINEYYDLKEKSNLS